MLKLSNKELDEVNRASAKVATLLYPPQYDCAEDLRNYTPTNFIFARDGSRLAGRILSSDLTKGATSPGVFAYFIPMLLLAFLCVFGALVSIFYFAAVPFVDIFHNGANAIASHGVVDGILSSIWGVTSYFMVMNAILSIPMLGVAFFVFLWLSEQECTTSFTRVFVYICFAGVAIAIAPGTGLFLAFLALSHGAFKMFSGKSAAILVVALSPVLGALLCLAVGLFGIWYIQFWMSGIRKARENAIRRAVAETKADSLVRDYELMERSRKAQADFSLKDKTPFILIGKSTGALRRDGDALTPDPGRSIGLTVNDLSMHMFVTGKSGSGKTVFVLRPIARQWIQNDCGGVLVFDPGKSELPFDLESDLDKVITPENTKVNIIEGLSPEVAAATFFAALKTKEGGIWDSSAEKDVRQALFVLNYGSTFPHIRAVAPYCIQSLYSFCLNKDYREALLKCLPAPTDSYMKEAFEHWINRVPDMAAETRSGVEFNVFDWLGHFVLHSKLDNWIGEDSEINIREFVAKGGKLGLAAPENRYGTGGTVAMSLFRASFYDYMSFRGTSWQKIEGQRPVLLIVDECAAGITMKDVDFARVARSFGCTMLYAVQDYESITMKLSEITASGDQAMKGFINQFSSSITLITSIDTLRIDCDRAGHRNRWTPDEKSSSAPLMNSVMAEQSSGFLEENNGNFIETLRSVTGVISNWKKAFSTSVQSDNTEKNILNQEATMSGQYKIRCTIDPEELELQLATSFHALVSLKRAKSPWREVADLTMWHPDNLAKQQVQKIAA